MKLLFTLVTVALIAGVHSQLTGLVVHTQQGDVAGTLPIPTVRQFIGIPYATAKRWEAPQPAPRRNSVFRATSFGDSCVQTLSASNIQFINLVGGDGINVTESENCLSINIWSPSIRRKQGTAVMLWIYGGGFAFGTSNINGYHGQNIVRDNDDVTVVTFNYRLNIFGQPGTPQLASESKSQNFGLLDLDAAVNWVHDNIANFGGDPSRIILFGQSAGSAAADAYTFAHPHDTIVKGIIEQSGTGANATLNPTAWNTVANAVGCASTAAQFSCMQTVPFRTLENAVISTNSAFNLVMDDITVFSDTATRAATGNFLQVPMIGGSTAQEADIFVVVQELVTLGFTIPVVTELGFTCSAGIAAVNRVKVGVPTWRYQYQGIFPDISIRSDLRSFHASEIPLVFGTYNLSSIPATPAEIALSSYIQQAWVSFARDPKQGLLKLGWPVYNPNATTLIQLGNQANQSGFVLGNGELLDSSCQRVDVLQAVAVQLGGLLLPGKGV
ncbi:carboxylesterase [Crucibulum laeve]|uniref:Carboxylic ester hydrolase n=1 Tax=Crucibulum laeve TaxID=68775 RepID=A0A5C3MJE9_9AGAR|nr:carboxylesterase [Crucibulum laeve]